MASEDESEDGIIGRHLMRMLRDDLVQRARSEDMRVPRQWAFRITDIDTRITA